MRAKRYAAGAALIAGGSGGIGTAIAKTLAAQGSDIVFTWHRNAKAAEALIATIGGAGRRVRGIQVDLTDDGAVVEALAAAAEAMQGLHTAVYAAGPYIKMRHISKLDPRLFRDTLSTDIFGCFHVLHAALPYVRAAGGAMAAIATPAIRRYAVKDVMSSAPKAAIESLVKGIAAEEGRFGVRANCVGVGVIEDGMFHQLVASGDFDQRFLEAARGNTALRKLGSAQDVANAVAFLLSDDAAFITGQTLMVDGGFAI